MAFDLASVNPNIILQLPSCGCKSIAKRNINVLMLLFIVVITTDHDLLMRHCDIDPDLVEVAMVLMMVFRFNGNPTAGDVVAMLFQFCSFFPNAGFNRIRMLNAMESDF